MTQVGRRYGFWQSIRDLPGRTPLRTKLIAAVVALVAIALAVISLVSIVLLRNYLLTPVDQNLAGLASRVELQLRSSISLNTNQPQPAVGEAVIWVPDSGPQQYLVAPVNPYGFRSGQSIQQVPGPAVPANADALPTNADDAITVGSTSGGSQWRIVGIPSSATTPNGNVTRGTVVVATDATSVYRTISGLTLIDLLVSIGVIVLLGALAAGLIRASLRPLVEIERTAGAIADGDLSRRVPEADPRTEVGRLGESLNTMLSHIQSAFESRASSEAAARRSEWKMRQFVADASHELRTPLTTIRGFAEYYRHRGGLSSGANGAGKLSKADLDRNMRRVEQEATRMGVLVEDMLLLARLDQQRPLEAKPVDLLTLAADAVQDARVVAPDRSVNLTVDAGTAPLVIGDEVRLRQVIGNLMTNALTHTPDGTPIEVLIRPGRLDEANQVQAEQHSDDTDDFSGSADAIGLAEPVPAAAGTDQPAAVLEVADHGPGLTREQAKHVFERFYRADHARTPGGTGGLGLAIVAALVAAHGGATWVRSRQGAGATFSIALPLAPEAVMSGEPEAEDEEPGDNGSEAA